MPGAVDGGVDVVVGLDVDDVAGAVVTGAAETGAVVDGGAVVGSAVGGADAGGAVTGVAVGVDLGAPADAGVVPAGVTGEVAPAGGRVVTGGAWVRDAAGLVPPPVEAMTATLAATARTAAKATAAPRRCLLGDGS